MITKDFVIIIEKIKDLCTELLTQKAYIEYQQTIEKFRVDEQAVGQYERFIELQQSLDLKKRQGNEVTKAEYEAYDRDERLLYDHSVIRKYLFARGELDNLERMLAEYISLTIETGRLPEPRELSKVSHGCGSH